MTIDVQILSEWLTCVFYCFPWVWKQTNKQNWSLGDLGKGFVSWFMSGQGRKPRWWFGLYPYECDSLRLNWSLQLDNPADWINPSFNIKVVKSPWNPFKFPIMAGLLICIYIYIYHIPLNTHKKKTHPRCSMVLEYLPTFTPNMAQFCR